MNFTSVDFNNKVSELLKALVERFPDNNDFKTLKSGFTMVKAVKEDLAVTIFKNHVLPKYRDFIVARDEKFFLEYKDYEADLSQMKYTTQIDYWNNLIDMVKDLWVSMTPDDKKAIWDYLCVLTVMAEKMN